MAEVRVRPAEPVVSGSSTHGGFADIARRLNALHPEREKPISRQLVERWYKCRDTNRMPERCPVQVDGKEKVLFNLQAVEQWHTRWLRERGAEPPIETIPMFQVDHRGHPIDSEQSSYRGHPSARESSSYRESILDL